MILEKTWLKSCMILKTQLGLFGSMISGKCLDIMIL